MILPNAKRIRSLIANEKTEQGIAMVLRSHKIRYRFTTETGFLSIRVPCLTGCIRIFRTCSRSYPFVVRQEKPHQEQLPRVFAPVYLTNYDN